MTTETDNTSTPEYVEENKWSAEKSLVEKASGYSLILAILVFLANMVAAWWITGSSSEVIGRPLIEQNATVLSLALDATHGATANSQILLNRMIDTELMLRAAQNRHTITVVALSVAFALVAIGFALFVMGAEGAFRLEGKMSDQGNLMVKATAPGLLCFVLAMIIVCFSLFTKTEITPGAFEVYPDYSMRQQYSGVEFAGGEGGHAEAVVAEEVPEIVEIEPERVIEPED